MNVAYCSMGSLLAELHGLFPPALIGDAGLERLYALTRRLPFCVTDQRFGFEFHLCDPNPTADFFVIASPETRLADFFGCLNQRAEYGLIGPDFATFLAEQSGPAPKSFLARTNKGIILEYDLAGSPPGAYGIPGIFISSRNGPEIISADLTEDPDALVEALWSAAGWEPNSAETRQVKRACVALAASAIGVAHAGIMPGRRGRAVRLVTRSVDVDKVPAALEQVRWPGDPYKPAAVIADFAGLVYPRVGIDLDITPSGVLPRLGLEFSRIIEPSRPEERFRLDRAGWKPAIDRLEESGWCLPAKADGLRAWPRLDTFFGRDGVYQVRQIINHFKMVIDPGAVFAKAYAGMDVRRVAP